MQFLLPFAAALLALALSVTSGSGVVEDGDGELPPSCSTCSSSSPSPGAPFGPHVGLDDWLDLTVSVSSLGGTCAWESIQGSQPPKEECVKLRTPARFWGSIRLRIEDASGGSIGNLVPDPNGTSSPKWILIAGDTWEVSLGDSQDPFRRACGENLPISFEATPSGTSVQLSIDLQLGCAACSGATRPAD